MAAYKINLAAARIRKAFAPVIKKYLPEKLAALLRKWGNKIIGSTSLRLALKELSTVPPVRLPSGYYSAALSPGHEMDYVRVIQRSLAADADMAWFGRHFSDDPEYDPDNLLLIYEDTLPVAAAAAWHAAAGQHKTGLVHMVGVDRQYQGRGLGRAVTLLALHRLQERGFHEVLVETEEVRVAALGLYLSLGFKPLCRNRSEEKRWKRVIRKTGLSMH
jgi:ribosomal protein S18 acetylase RimI-like enzyme